MPRQPKHRAPRVAPELPQLEESWHVVTQRMRAWVIEDEDNPIRPWLVLVLNLSRQLIQHVGVASGLDSATVLAVLREGMQKRENKLRLKPHRPTLIYVEQETLATALAPELNALEVEVQVGPRPEGVDQLIGELEASMSGGAATPPGLLTVRGVKLPFLASFFAAGADFYHAALWNDLTDEHSFLVDVPRTGRKRIVVIMGNAGMEYGLSVYDDWADFERMFQPADDIMEKLPAKGAHALHFNEITMVPFADLDLIEQQGWPIAEKNAYPVPVILKRNGDVRRPPLKDLQWYEAALRALPVFVRDQLRRNEQGALIPTEADVTVTTSLGETEVHITYPAGVLPNRLEQATRWVMEGEADDDEGGLDADRRALEGMLAGLGVSLGGQRGGRSAVERAQEIMYQAWDERSAAKRIALAQKALKTSPDCADAYVLLAEEAAKTLGETLTYYEQGVAAGERALGRTFFRDHVGHFWGLLETRPYMRARQGLATTLWKLDRKAEAAEHFRELLRLNPGDNQGIRYNLLNLLLDMDDNAAARALLEEYDDGMAEWLYTQALLAFRANGAGRKANSALKAALKMNPHVPAYLTGRKRLPATLPPYIGFGDENEAQTYASGYLKHWRKTPGALEWLQAAK